MSEFKFYSAGENDFDAHVDEYVIVPQEKMKENVDLFLSGRRLKYIGNNTFHWQRYYSHSLRNHKVKILHYFEGVISE